MEGVGHVVQRSGGVTSAGVSGILCVGPVFPSYCDEPLAEHDGELGLCLTPFSWRHFPVCCDLAQDEPEQLCRGLVGRKMPSRSNGSAQFGGQCLDGVHGVNDPPYPDREGKKRNDMFPVSPPAQSNCRI